MAYPLLHPWFLNGRLSLQEERGCVDVFCYIPSQTLGHQFGYQGFVRACEDQQIEIIILFNSADDICIDTRHARSTEAKGFIRKFGKDFAFPFFTFFNRLFRGGVQMYHLQFVICAEYMTKTEESIDVRFHISRKKTNIIQCASYSIPWNS